ncbi:hypothetical protein ACFLY1_01050, partial [Patescibacteria group bacterium]
MPESKEQFNPYSEERARREASKMEEKIEGGEATNYREAEDLIEQEKRERNLDFSKDEDREFFDSLPEKRKEAIKEKAHENALIEDE